jgi:hypothetical protein
MGVEDDRAFLKAKLDDRNMKCGNCNSWHASEIYPGRGLCAHKAADSQSGLHSLVQIITQDLSVCSEWIRKA